MHFLFFLLYYLHIPKICITFAENLKNDAYSFRTY